jgi:hypothetical protein
VTQLITPRISIALAVLEYFGSAFPLEYITHAPRLTRMVLMVPTLRLAHMSCLLSLLWSSSLLTSLTIGGVTRSIVSTALLHHFQSPLFLPSLRRVIFPGCFIDASLLQIALLPRRLDVGWTVR